MTAPKARDHSYMAKNRTGNRLERRFRMLLVKNRLRHVVQPKRPMSPDFYLPDQNVYVFLDGCFWHYCPAHHRQPKTNVPYWNKKRAMNAFHEHQRKRLTYRWIRVWEHDLDQPGLLEKMGLKIAYSRATLPSSGPFEWPPAQQSYTLGIPQ